MDYQRDDIGGSKAVTPKVVMRRPGSREAGGILPGLRIGNYNSNIVNRNQEQLSQNEDSQFPQSTKMNNQVMIRSNMDLARIGSRENIGSKTLVPIRSQNDLLSREVDKEINNMQVQTRLRDLESMIIDFKGNIERRISKIQDEQPGKFMANFKRLEDKEGQMWKDNSQKQGMITDQYQIMRETIRKNNELNGQQLLELQRKIDEVAFQNHKLQKNQEQLQVYVKNAPQQAIENNGKKRYDPQEGQLSLLKEQFSQELRVRENAFEDLNRNYQDLQKKVYEQEKEFLVRLQKQRDQIIDETNVHKLQIKQLEGVKMEKLLGENDYLKSLIDQVERRLEDEMDKRLKQEFENKAYLEQKMNLFKDEVRNEEKAIIEGEQKFVKQMHDSIQSIHQIIKYTKEELEANLASTQTLFSENIKNFGQQIEVMKETLETKVMLLERGYKEVNFKMNETKQQFHEHANTINMQVDRQNEVIDGYEQTLRKNIQEIDKEMKQKFIDIEKESELWKDKFEKKNLAIFQEISNAMKGLKQDMNLDKKDNIARFKDMKEEVDSYQKMNEKLINNLKEHTDRIQQSTEYLISENDKKHQEQIAQAQVELEKMMRQLDETQFDRAKEFTISKIVALDEKICNELNEVMGNFRIEINTSINKVKDTLETTIVEKEKNLLDKLKNNKIYTEELFDQLQRMLKKDQNDLFEFRQQHMEDLRSLRKENLDNLQTAMNELSLEMDSKIDVEHKKWEMALLISSRQLERQIEELNARFNEGMDKLKEELIERFRKELEEVVMKKIMQEIQQEKNERIRRENEIETSMHNIKNMILEALHQKVESAKALARALVTEEAAERAKNDEEILRVMKDSIDTLDRTLRQLIKTSIEECMYILRNEIKKLEDQLNEFKEWTMKELKKIQDEIKDWQNEIRAENYLRDQYQKLRDEELQEVIGKIEFELVSIKKNREEDLLLLIQEINVRQDEIARVDVILQNHNSLIELQRFDHEALRSDFDQHSEWAKQAIQKQREDFDKFKSVTDKNVRFLDEEIKHHYKYFEGRIYLDNMYNRVQVEAIIEQSQTQRDRIKQIFAKLKEIILQINENFQQQENFEEKTEKNFKIAEKAIRSHTQFLNSLDARLHLEEIMGKLAAEDLQFQNNQVRKEMNQNLVLMNEEINKQMSKMKDEQNKQIDELENRTVEMQNKLDEHETKLEEQNNNIENNKKLIALVETDLKATEHELNQKLDDGIQNVTDNINQIQQENEQFKEDVNTKLDEASQRIDEVNQKTDDNNQKADEIMQKADDINQRIDEESEKINQLEEKANQNEEKFNEFEQKANQVEEKVQAIEEKINEIEEKSNQTEEKVNQIDEKINEFEEKANQMEEKINQIEEKSNEIVERANQIEEQIKEIEENNNKKLDDQSKQNAQLDQQAEEKIGEIEVKLNEYEQKQQELQELLVEKEKNIEDLGEDIHKQMERIDQLEEQVEELKNNKEKDKENSKQSEQLNNSKQNDHNESFQKKFNELDEQIQKLEEQIQDMQNKQVSTSKDNNKVNASKDSQEVELMKQEMEEAKQDIKEMKEQMEDVQNNLNAVGQALEEYKEISDRFDKLETRIASVESKK